MNQTALTFYEFFAGGGMARAGLGGAWTCTFANDFDKMKVATYQANWGEEDIRLEDVAKLKADDLPGTPDLAWASFPCQDLSLAGDYRGLGKATSAVMTRSGTFWPFWRLMQDLCSEGRAPRTIVLENVYGVLTSRKGKDFSSICSTLSDGGYWFGAVVINARSFVPQSRPRVFFIAVKKEVAIPAELTRSKPHEQWHPAALVGAKEKIPTGALKDWVWWNMPAPSHRTSSFADLVEENPSGVTWHTPAQTKHLLGLMSPLHKSKVAAAKKAGGRSIGCLYRRTRPDDTGEKVQRAEVRFDDVAGCLRTPAGGSSRQTILLVEDGKIRSRLLSPREAARLMGLEDSYRLPARYNDAYHVAGDGVCPPVVRFLAANLLEPILTAAPVLEGLFAAE